MKLTSIKCLGVLLLTAITCHSLGQEVYAPATPASGILTPVGKESPQINGPNVFGVRPGSPVLYFIPVSGKRPIAFSAKNLPAGLKLDAATGHITSVINTPGKYKLTLTAVNALSKSSKVSRLLLAKISP
jgi:alpha-galactosidase